MSNALLDALQYAGDTLNKPGRAVRGLLGGRPDELANLVPFSDTIGLTDPSKQVTGRALLEQMGALSPKQEGEGFGLGDVAGIGMDIATDPITWMSGAGIGKILAPNVASKLGRGAKALAAEETGAFVNPLTTKLSDVGKAAEAAAPAAKGAEAAEPVVGKAAKDIDPAAASKLDLPTRAGPVYREASDAAKQHQAILDAINTSEPSANKAAIAEHAMNLASMSKAEIDKLLPEIGIAGKMSKKKAIDTIQMVLRNQSEMASKSGAKL